MFPESATARRKRLRSELIEQLQLLDLLRNTRALYSNRQDLREAREAKLVKARRASFKVVERLLDQLFPSRKRRA